MELYFQLEALQPDDSDEDGDPLLLRVHVQAVQFLPERETRYIHFTILYYPRIEYIFLYFIASMFNFFNYLSFRKDFVLRLSFNLNKLSIHPGITQNETGIRSGLNLYWDISGEEHDDDSPFQVGGVSLRDTM